MTPQSAAAPIFVTDEEQAVLSTASRDGFVSAELYTHGDFNEAGFVLFGRLEVMCLKGLLRFVDRVGESERAPGDVHMVFALPDRGGSERGRLVAA
jgi:hypothetical protein